ncbi:MULTISPECIES: hypothetical protein [unclassified Pantoea]|uniref:hypothetical protein n=1 Tax=unclassified Pantoea TaxID=2630326 RepID=UPI0002584482|nr:MULTISPECIES: hypothetical protein [unclassified Pantoea]EIC00068.1 hypothetical protein S7A_16190 [Pantoea sp. Sc1]KAA5976053.1 hypothetical protein F3I51_01195 [Pantoea sp. M_6]KAA5976782.1 hypothetical protein F3I52_11170 [Pantoea sp. M_8]KAA5990874.1 hypothetical protein F3I47_11245 [Pantoea sp. M_10]KAA5995410.1 hypothetical protein F3I50_16205 [Pantoea sp. M_5]
MEAKRVPAGFRILIAVSLFVITFLIARPSDPSSEGEQQFWTALAKLFNQRDIEGFVGVALLIICTVVTLIGYQIIVRVIEKRVNKR